MFHGRDPSSEIVCEANRAFVVESGPIRPIIDFPASEMSGRKFKFQKKWYDQYGTLEYSLSKDAAFCYSCRCFGALGKQILYIFACLVPSCQLFFQLLKCQIGYVKKDLFDESKYYSNCRN